MLWLYLGWGRPIPFHIDFFFPLYVFASRRRRCQSSVPYWRSISRLSRPRLWRWRGALDGSRYSVFSFKETPAAAALLLLPMSLLSVHTFLLPPPHTAACSGQRLGPTKFFIHFPSNRCRFIIVHITANHNLKFFLCFCPARRIYDPEMVQ